MKLIGSLILISATTLYGIRMAKDMEVRYGQLRELQRLLYFLKSEITYSRAYLGEAFLHIAEQAKEPYEGWMRQLSRQMNEREGVGFEAIWKTAIHVHLKDLKLEEREKGRLLELGNCLCGGDLAVQIKSIELCEEQLSYTMEEIREGMGTKKKLCHCLGVMSGVFLAILLL